MTKLWHECKNTCKLFTLLQLSTFTFETMTCFLFHNSFYVNVRHTDNTHTGTQTRFYTVMY